MSVCRRSREEQRDTPDLSKVGVTWVSETEARTVHEALEAIRCEACNSIIECGEHYVPCKMDFSFFALCRECLPIAEVEEKGVA